MPGSTTTFLDLDAGPYRLALSADHVLGVVPDATPPVALRGEELRFCDLSSLFTGATRTSAPFAVCFETEGQRVAVGVDRVDHLRVLADTALLNVPPFGLNEPQLFNGVLRDNGGLLLVLDPDRLAQLTAPK